MTRNKATYSGEATMGNQAVRYAWMSFALMIPLAIGIDYAMWGLNEGLSEGKRMSGWMLLQPFLFAGTGAVAAGVGYDRGSADADAAEPKWTQALLRNLVAFVVTMVLLAVTTVVVMSGLSLGTGAAANVGLTVLWFVVQVACFFQVNRLMARR